MTHSIDDEAAERVSVSTRPPEQAGPDPVQGEQEAPPSEASRQSSQRAEAPVEHGTPAGQMALGAASVLTLGGLGLYQTVGVLGLVAGGGVAVAGGSGYAYWRFRKARPRKDRRDQSPRSSGSGRNRFGGSTSRSGRRAVFSAPGSSSAGRSPASRSVGGRAGAGRAAARMPSLGGSRTRGLAGGKRMMFPSGRASVGGRASGGARSATHKAARGGQRQRGPISTAAHKVGGASRQLGRMASKGAQGVRTAGTRTAGAARTVAGQTRRAAAWADRKTGGHAGRAFGHASRAGRRMGKATGHSIATQARRVGGWVDRKTGRRVSSAWHATRGAEGFRAARQRASAVLGGWDAQLTASLVALVALLVDRWRARKAAVEQPEKDAPTAEDAEGDSEVGQGDPALTWVIACPRCGARRKVTIPADEFDTWIRCRCGLKICVYRAPIDPPDDWDKPEHTSRFTERATPKQKGSGMSGMITHATELPTIASGYETEDMMQVKGDLEMLRELPLQVAAAIRLMTERLSADYPIHQDVVERLHVVYEGFAQLANACDEVSNTFQAAHEADILRRLEPRTGEQKWNHQ